MILLVEEAEVTVDAVDSWGHTPEGDARLAGHHEVAQYLRKVSADQDKCEVQNGEPTVLCRDLHVWGLLEAILCQLGPWLTAHASQLGLLLCRAGWGGKCLVKTLTAAHTYSLFCMT